MLKDTAYSYLHSYCSVLKLQVSSSTSLQLLAYVSSRPPLRHHLGKQLTHLSVSFIG